MTKEEKIFQEGTNISVKSGPRGTNILRVQIFRSLHFIYMIVIKLKIPNFSSTCSTVDIIPSNIYSIISTIKPKTIEDNPLTMYYVY